MLSLIVNPSAGGGRAGSVLAEVQGALSELGLEHHVERTTSLEHARDLARAATGKSEIAVALGGDGLIGAVADALRHSDGVLGVLPGGRGNDFARGLGIPPEPRAACRVLADGEARRLDGGEPRTLIGYTIAAANSKAYGGGMFMAPDASLQDGLLDVVLVGDVPKLRFLRLLPTVFKGEHVQERNVEVLRGREVEISADRPFTLYADGDPIAQLPVTVRALPRAVRVMVPK